MATTIKGIAVEIGGSLNGLTQTLGQVEGKFQGLGKKLGGIAGMISKAVVGSLVAAGTASVKMASDFEASMTKINTLVGIAEDQVDSWRAALLRMGPEVAAGPKELADALFVVSSAGQRGAEALNIVEQAAKASALGLGETETIARAVTGAMNAYSDSGLTAAEATDTLTAIVREGNLEASQLAPTLGRVVGIASQLGVSFQEVGANIATFTRLGVDSAEAVTGVRAILSSMIAPGKQAAEALAEVGLSSEMLRNSLREGGLQQTLATLTERFEGNTEGLAKVIPNIRALSAVMGTAGSQAEDYAKVLKSIQNSAGLVDSEFAKLEDTLDFQIEAFKASGKAALIAFGETLLPVVKAAVKGLRGLTDFLRTTVAPAFAVVAEKAGQMFEKYGPLIDEVKGVVGELIDVARDFWDEWGGEISNFISDVSDSFMHLARAGTETLSGLAALMRGDFKDAARHAAEAIKEIISAFARWDEDVYDKVRALREELDESTRATARQRAEYLGLTELLEDYGDEQEEAAQSSGEWIKATMEANAVGGEYNATVFEQMKAVEGLIGQTNKGTDSWQQNTEAVEDAEEAARELARATEEELERRKKWNKALQQSGQDIRKFANSLAPVPEKLKKLAELFLKVKDGLYEFRTLPQMQRDINTAINGTIKRMEAMQDAIDELWNEWRDGVEEAVDSMSAFDNIQGILHNFGRDIELDGLKGAFRKAFTNLNEESTNFIMSAFGPQGQIAGVITRFFGLSGPWGIAIAAGLKLLKPVTKMLKGLVGGSTGGLSGTILSGIREAFEQIANEARVLGEDFDRASAEIAVLEDAMIQMLNEGVLPSNPAFRMLEEALIAAREGAILASEALAMLGSQGAGFLRGAGIDPSGLGNIDLDFGGLWDQDAWDAWVDSLGEANEEAKQGSARFGGFLDVIRDFITIIDEGKPQVEVLNQTNVDYFQQVADEMDRLRTLAQLLGEPFNELEAEAELLAEHIEDLINKGFRPGNPILDDLLDRYNELNKQLEKQAGIIRETTRDTKTLADIIKDKFQAGLAGLEQVLGLTGDRTQFLSDAMRMASEAQRRLEAAVADGTLSVEEAEAAWLYLQEQIRAFREEAEQPITPPDDDEGTGGGGAGAGTGPPQIIEGDVIVDIDFEPVTSLLVQVRDVLRNILAVEILSSGLFGSGSIASQLQQYLYQTQGLGFGQPFGRNIVPPGGAGGGGGGTNTINTPALLLNGVNAGRATLQIMGQTIRGVQ